MTCLRNRLLTSLSVLRLQLESLPSDQPINVEDVIWPALAERAPAFEAAESLLSLKTAFSPSLTTLQ